MIDSTFVWLYQDSIEIKKPIWDEWCANFIKVVIESDCIFVNSHGGYKLSSPVCRAGNGRAANLFWWDSERVVLLAVGGRNTLEAVVAPQIKQQDIPLDRSMEQLVQLVFSKLAADRNVVNAFKAHAASIKAKELADIKMAADGVKDAIRVRADDECGLSVLFITPNSNPEQLYYILGAEMRFIKEVRSYLDDGKETVIGNMDSDVDFGVSVQDDRYTNKQESVQ